MISLKTTTKAVAVPLRKMPYKYTQNERAKDKKSSKERQKMRVKRQVKCKERTEEMKREVTDGRNGTKKKWIGEGVHAFREKKT